MFDELTALTNLQLQGNDLTAGVFDNLTALTALTLPAGVFDKLTALTSLYLFDNSLTTLPAGVFDELTSLTTSEAAGQFGGALLAHRGGSAR